MGRPKYIEDRFAMIYGPPYHAEHECSKCGHTWTNSGLGSDRQSFCPKCGGEYVYFTPILPGVKVKGKE